MEYTRLGPSGLMVSRIALGCMSFGDTSKGFNGWALDDAAAEPIFRQAVDLGITFWDTANIYGFGSSEEIVGRAINRYSRREDVVLATKLRFRMHDGPGGSGLSRKAVLEQIDASLRRLGTDHVDLYQIHRFDPDTPVEETMEALHDVVKAGKVRYLGASSMWAWQFATMQHAADLHGWTRFVSMQNQYSLLQREEEREMFGLLADQGVGSVPWSPLAKGRLARPWGEQTERSANDPLAQRYVDDSNPPIVAAVQQVAAARGIPMAQVGAGVGAAAPGRRGPDRRADQAAPPGRRGGGPGRRPHRRGDRHAGGAVHAAGAVGLLTPVAESVPPRGVQTVGGPGAGMSPRGLPKGLHHDSSSLPHRSRARHRRDRDHLPRLGAVRDRADRPRPARRPRWRQHLRLTAVPTSAGR